MKRHLVKTTILLLGLTLGLRADESPNKMTGDRMRAFEEEILQISWSVIRTPPKSQRLREYAISNNIPEDVFVSTMEKIAEGLIADTVVYKDFRGNDAVGFRDWEKLAGLINIMGRLGDPEFLPWLEHQATESEHSGVREFTAIAYVKSAGLDAVPFVRKILSGNEDKYDLNCKNLVSREFFEQVAKAEAAKAQQEKIDAAYTMLVEQAQTVGYVGDADRIDKFLCERLKGYQASVQREKVIARFVDSENEMARTNFRKKFEELQKTPRAERIDLRIRFPGLAALENSGLSTTNAPVK